MVLNRGFSRTVSVLALITLLFSPTEKPNLPILKACPDDDEGIKRIDSAGAILYLKVYVSGIAPSYRSDNSPGDAAIQNLPHIPIHPGQDDICSG